MGWGELIEASVAAGGPIDVRHVAAACGLTPRAVRDRARREGWWRPYPSIVAVPGAARDGRAWARAAVLHATGRTGDPERDLAAVTRSSALAVLGLHRSFPTRTEVIVSAARVLAPAPRLTVIRSALVTPDDLGSRDGIAVVTGPALLRDLAAVRDIVSLRAAAIDLAKAGVVDLEALPRFLEEQPGFPGKPRLRQVVADLIGAGRTDSPFELQVRARLSAEGIALDRGQVRIPGPVAIHLDLGIAAIRFGIECDSMGFHSSRTALDRDARRANLLASTPDDWRVLHATWSVLAAGWRPFVEQVRTVICEQSRRYLGQPWPTPEHLQ